MCKFNAFNVDMCEILSVGKKSNKFRHRPSQINEFKIVYASMCSKNLLYPGRSLVNTATPNFNPFPYDKFWRTSNLTEFADDNFKFDENG